MKLYFAPMACSLAPHIALIEAGATYTHEAVDLRSKKTASGADFLQINPQGYVPALEVGPGQVITEAASILQYIAEVHPEAGLLPQDPVQRAQMRSWLNFIAMELHKNFSAFFNPFASDEVKGFSGKMIAHRLKAVDQHLEGRETLVDSFTVADIYLGVVLSWAQYVKVDLAPFPNAQAFLARVGSRPSFAQALGEEGVPAR